MFWADRLAEEIEARYGKERVVLIRDEKTTSGYAHIGSMLSAAMHGSLAEALARRGVPHRYLFESNDLDAFDSVPVYVPQDFSQYLGRSLRDVPTPEFSEEKTTGAKNYAEFFARDYREVITGTGYTPEYYYAHELYDNGRMDGVIREALEAKDVIRTIYQEVSGGSGAWETLPLMVRCPACKNIASTVATDFDGETVAYWCPDQNRAGVVGCGKKGRVSPFGGTSKLPWKVEWAAKWKVLGVMIEGAGKDHYTKGGSRHVANRISTDVFHYPSPFDIPHEFFLVGGKKISSSKGLGSTARAIYELLPQKIFRLCLLAKERNQQVNFDPEGDTIPMLYDQYDKLALHYSQNVGGAIKDDYMQLFEALFPLSLTEYGSYVSDVPHEPCFNPRFSQIAYLVQMPHLDLQKEVLQMKAASLKATAGEVALTEADRAEQEQRREYAKRWLREYAPEKYVFKLYEDTLPEGAKGLSEAQKAALRMIHERLVDPSAGSTGEAMHALLHEVKEEAAKTLGLSSAEFFGAIYLSLVNKDHGPKAGWFLSVLGRQFLLDRLKVASE